MSVSLQFSYVTGTEFQNFLTIFFIHLSIFSCYFNQIFNPFVFLTYNLFLYFLCPSCDSFLFGFLTYPKHKLGDIQNCIFKIISSTDTLYDPRLQLYRNLLISSCVVFILFLPLSKQRSLSAYGPLLMLTFFPLCWILTLLIPTTIYRFFIFSSLPTYNFP